MFNKLYSLIKKPNSDVCFDNIFKVLDEYSKEHKQNKKLVLDASNELAELITLARKYRDANVDDRSKMFMSKTLIR